MMAIVAMGIALILKKIKRLSTFDCVIFGLTVFCGLFLLEALVIKRIGVQIEQHPGFDILAEYNRLVHGNDQHRFMFLINVLAFVPIGFLMTGCLFAEKRMNFRRIIGIVSLIVFLLSLSIESLQWILRVGLFELTDIVLNTLGAIVGSAIAIGLSVVTRASKCNNLY